MIEIDDLTVRFGGVRSLDRLTVTLVPRLVGVIGPNGAGKTTLLNALSGFVEPVSGRLVVDGTDLTGMPATARARWGVRRTFQQTRIAGRLSAWDNVAATADSVRLGSRLARRQAVAAALDTVGFCGSGSERIDELSSLAARQVELARAVVGAPRVLLADEPAAGLPHDESELIRTALRAIVARTAATVVLVDHDVDLIRDVCDEVAVLDFGQLVVCGPTADALADPRVVAAYLGVAQP